MPNQFQTALLISILNLTLALLPMGGPRAAAAAETGGMCAGQPGAMTEKELAEALSLMREIMNLAPRPAPGDEETIIRGRGLTSSRLNCLLGKFMAGNDIFNWGTPEAYGVSLSEEEAETARRFAGEAAGLRRYLEEALNIKPGQGD